jgi:acetolactate synthase I/III small subunit
MQNSRILVALVENKSGVLNRIASLFRRRRFNIESLTVGHSEQKDRSRMTIIVDESTNVDQVFRQMYKIIEVCKIKRLNPDEAIMRNLALVKIKNTTATKKNLLKVLRKFHAKIIIENSKNLILEIVGEPEKLEQFFEEVKKFKILEISRTGTTSIATIR